MGIFEALRCWIGWLAKTLYYYMIEAVEFVLDAIALAINAVISILPSVERPNIDSIDGGILGMINYVIPLGVIFGWCTLIMICWVLYRLYQWLLAWGKVDY